MVVKFDNTALRQTVEHKTEPIGVEGDPSSTKQGGISEADALVREARKSMGDLPVDGHGSEHEIKKVSRESIREEERKEPGPELDPQGPKKMSKEITGGGDVRVVSASALTRG